MKKTYLLTIYSIKTNMAFIQAENLENAQKQIADQGDSIKWMEIPMMNYMSWCEDGEPIGVSVEDAINLVKENYSQDVS